MKRLLLLFPVFFIFTCSILARDFNKPIRFLKPYRFTYPSVTSNPNDFFRSAQTGDWSLPTTWESSPDNGITPWVAATSVPTSAANTISIRNGHTVTVSSNQDMDQLFIESGGILFHSAGILTINDDVSGDDVIVKSGGVFTLSSAANPPVFSVSSASVNINTGGMLRVSATGLTAAAPNPGVNTANYIYQNASVLEYTPNLAFSSSGVTYFPNVDAVTIPVFRTTGNMGLIGGINQTVINGLFEANGTITFSNSAPKTFRNGITGTGNIGNDGTSGKFIINGLTASMGGTGSLTLPVSGMEIGINTTVTMVSDKTVTGNIALLSNALVMLGSYNLNMAGDVTGGNSTSHIVTNSTGKLVINNITGPTKRSFPIGANTTSINPLALYNGGGLNYGARVEIGLNPSIRFPISAVNRSWFVTPNGGVPGTVNTDFYYYAGDGNALFNYTANLELGLYTNVWNVIQTGLIPAGAYRVSTSVNNFGNNIESPLVLGNLGAILAVNNSIKLTAQKQNDKTILNWTVDDHADILQFNPERSADGRTYTALAALTAAEFSFTDLQPMPGLNYYRLKMKDKNGKILYSNIAVILNAKKGIQFISISSNPVVNGSLKLNIAAAEKTQLEIVITDIQGRVMQKQKVSLIAGFNTIPMNVANLATGTYQVYAVTADGRSTVLRFVIQ